mgnify:CR=1 FL=1
MDEVILELLLENLADIFKYLTDMEALASVMSKLSLCQKVVYNAGLFGEAPRLNHLASSSRSDDTDYSHAGSKKIPSL